MPAFLGRCPRAVFTKTSFVTHVFLLCFLFLPAQPSQFQVERLNQIIQNKSSLYELSSLENTVFGIDHGGELTVDFKVKFNISTEVTLKLAACGMSQVFVRDTSFERRHLQRIGSNSLSSAVTCFLCGEDKLDDSENFISDCTERELHAEGKPFTLSTNSDPRPNSLLLPREMYFVTVYVCGSEAPDNLSFDLTGTVSYRNPGTKYPELGYEEALFPILALVVLCLLAATSLLLSLSLVLTIPLRLPIRQFPFAVLFACLMKGLMALLTFLYFSSVARSGSRERWYSYARLCLIGIADLSFVAVVLAISSGYRVFPSVWFADERSPIMFVYVGVTLQILIIIAVKITFPFKYLSTFPASALCNEYVPVHTSDSYSSYNFPLLFCTFNCFALSPPPQHVNSSIFNIFSYPHILFNSWCRGRNCCGLVKQKLPVSRAVRGSNRARTHLRQDDANSSHAEILCREHHSCSDSLPFQNYRSCNMGLLLKVYRSHVGIIRDCGHGLADVVRVFSSTA